MTGTVAVRLETPVPGTKQGHVQLLVLFSPPRPNISSRRPGPFNLDIMANEIYIT